MSVLIENGLYADPLLILEPGMHTGAVNGFDVDVAGRLLVTTSDDKTVRVWAISDGRLLNTLRLPSGIGDTGKAYTVSISPDGAIVAVGGWTSQSGTNESIYLYERLSGRLLRRFGGMPDAVFRLVFSPDGERLAVALSNGGVQLVNPHTGEVLARDAGYGGESYGVAFDRSGRIATTSLDGNVRLYDASLCLIASASMPSGWNPYGVAFSPDGDRLAVGYAEAPVVDVLNSMTLQRERRHNFGGGGTGSLTVVTWSADGAVLLASGLWPMQGDTHFVRWSDKEFKLLTNVPLSQDAVVGLRELKDGQVAFAAQDPRLGVVSADGRKLWAQGRATADLRYEASAFRISADGKCIAFHHACWSESNRLWNNEQLTFSITEQTLAPVTVPVPEGFVAAKTTASNFEISGWQEGYTATLNGKKLSLSDYERPHSLAITSDEQNFVLGTGWWLRFYSRNGQQIWRQAIPDAAWEVNVAADGRLIVAAYADGTLRWHRLADGEELLALYPHADRERWVLWTPRGHYAASPGGEDLIGWQVNRGWDEAPAFYSASRFRDRFHRPDVIALVLEELDIDKALARADREAGGRKSVERSLAQSLPPVVRIIDPADGTPIDGDDVIVRFEAEAADPVRSLMALVNGRLALRQPRPETVGGLVTGRLLVPVPPGQVFLSLIAENGQGASDPATVHLVARGGVASATAAKPTLHLIAVGVSDYKNHEHLRLKFAAKDATDLAERLLREKGGLYADVRPWPLLDDEADRRAILRTFREVQRELRPGDVAIVFFSGHGASEGTRYDFLPHDAEVDTPEAIADTGISHLDLREAFGKFFDAKAKVIALFDTCYSGNVVEGGRALPANVDIVAQELAAAENGVVVLTSSTGREVSRERDDLQNGIFTSALLEALAGKAGRSHEGYISLSDLRGYLPDRVAQLSGNRQRPTARVPFEKDWEAKIAVVR